ncbi:hypothetical protein NFI96_004709 [Prochilodus magdalenae]|nr:hypothetical protein NFI96_004709 [Prochilodus magdalenae]
MLFSISTGPLFGQCLSSCQRKLIPPLSLGSRIGKSLDTCLPCPLRDGGSSRAGPEAARARGTDLQSFKSDAGGYEKVSEGSLPVEFTLGLLGIAVSTDYWLYLEEGIILPLNQSTEIRMSLHSGLWRVCFLADSPPPERVLPTEEPVKTGPNRAGSGTCLEILAKLGKICGNGCLIGG